MEIKILYISVFLLLYSNHSAFAQQTDKDDAYKKVNIHISFDAVYNKTIDYLQDNGYFIVSLDKSSGFIQAKIYKKHNKVISTKVGERKILNFIIRPLNEEQANITLNIYCEELVYNGDISNRVDYIKDKGISKDRTLYTTILDDMQKSFGTF